MGRQRNGHRHATYQCSKKRNSIHKAPEIISGSKSNCIATAKISHGIGRRNWLSIRGDKSQASCAANACCPFFFENAPRSRR